MRGRGYHIRAAAALPVQEIGRGLGAALNPKLPRSYVVRVHGGPTNQTHNSHPAKQIRTMRPALDRRWPDDLDTVFVRYLGQTSLIDRTWRRYAELSCLFADLGHEVRER